jgi:hypothetical protein
MTEDTIKIIESYNVKDGTGFMLTERVYNKVMAGKELSEDDLKEAVFQIRFAPLIICPKLE